MKRSLRLLTGGWVGVGAGGAPSGDAMWERIEDALASIILDEMGGGSGYADLLISDVQAAAWYEPTKVSYPFCLIQAGSQQFGNEYLTGDANIGLAGIAYNLDVIFSVINDDDREARDNARVLAQRFIKILMVGEYMALNGLVDPVTGEAVSFVRPIQSQASSMPLPGTALGNSLGSATVSIVVSTEL